MNDHTDIDKCQVCGQRVASRTSSVILLLTWVLLLLLLLGCILFDATLYFCHNLHSNVGRQLRSSNNINARRLLGGDSNLATFAPDSNLFRKRISLVTSFWANDRNPDNIIPHRREVEAALLANIYNPHIDQIVIFLDSIITAPNNQGYGASTCHHFHKDMDELSHQFRQASSMTDAYTIDPMSKVTCVDLMSNQPTYHQMFRYATSDAVTGDIVVMANADMAFDDTLEQARKLKEDVLLVLGTKGFSAEMPLTTRHFYDVILGAPVEGADLDEDQCMTNSWSWDSWIFHKQSVKGKLNEEHFKRPTKRGDDELEFFYMNESSAENAALWAMEQSPGFVYTLNACEMIHSWSFHLTPKTHHNPGKSVWPHPPHVPRPWGGSKIIPRKIVPFPPRSCDRPEGCFY